jgi:ABC-2 type transport system ATP-binding protein
MSAVVEFAEICKDFRLSWWNRTRRRVLDNVTFRIEPGEVVGLVGPNRAGKSTLLKILLSLSTPDAGSVLRFGRPINDRGSLRRIGYIHELQSFPTHYSAASLLEFYGVMSLIPIEQVRKRIPGLLDRVGLADPPTNRLARFSKGMVARLALAQALINEPDLLVLDEPAEGLDLDGRRLFREAIAKQRQDGKTTLLVSHALGDIESVCTKLAVLAKGRIVYTGPVSGLTRDRNSGEDRPLSKALQELYRNLTS